MLSSGIQDIEEECRLTQDSKASRDSRNITEVRKVIRKAGRINIPSSLTFYQVLDCLQGHWNIRKRFEPEAGQGLPFLLEMLVDYGILTRG